MATPSEERSTPDGAEDHARLPIAHPPRRPRSRPRPATSAPVLPLTDPAAPLFADLWTAAALRGWAGSFGLHVLLLTCLGLWWFTPPLHEPVVFDSRLAGSPSGVDEGFELIGGLNTPLDDWGMDLELAESASEPLLPESAPASLAPLLSSRGNLDPSAGGGRPNDNPGAGEGDGFGIARFGEGGEVVRGVEVKVGDPQFTLIWDTDADLDLHVIEPGGKEIYWEDRQGNQGGELDVDNTKGFGPENVYWLVESDGPGSTKVKGPGPPGAYRWFVVYWGGFGGIPKVTKWQVRVKHGGRVTVHSGRFRALNERSRTYTLTVEPPPAPLLPPETP